jgi:hypothetical protein
MNLRDLPGYVVREIRENYDDPFWWRNRALHRIIGPFHLNVYPTRGGSIDVTTADWDTLVVLDACRVDLFEEQVATEEYEDYRVVTSRGSATREWTLQNWAGDTFGDVVYVTANPFVSREVGDTFHEIYEPWLTHFDEDDRTVHPADVTEVSKEAHEEHPNKRVVVHYMQPHHPFVTRPELQFHGWQITDFDEWEEHKDETGLAAEQRNAHPHTPWEALYMGEAGRAEIWEAYSENLDLAMDAVDDLVAAIDGRVVVTSDHGNMFGEWTWPIPMRVYGHPTGVRNSELVDVPWAVAQSGPRRSITAGDIRSASDSDREIVDERLEDLGYV